MKGILKIGTALALIIISGCCNQNTGNCKKGIVCGTNSVTCNVKCNKQCNKQCNKKKQDMSQTPVIDAIMSRRSIRHYKDTPVEREALSKIAQCGINAPNAMNKQEWEVRIVDSQEYFQEVTSIMKEVMPFTVDESDPKFRNGFRNATAAIFIACPDDPAGMSLINVGLMSENICLAAQEYGLGTCVMGGPAMFLETNETAKPYLDKLGFSQGYKLRIVIAVGYPDESPQAKPRDPNKVQFID